MAGCPPAGLDRPEQALVRLDPGSCSAVKVTVYPLAAHVSHLPTACGAGMRLVAVGAAGRHWSVVLAIVQWGFSWGRQGGDEAVSKFLGGHFPERRVYDQSSGERWDVVTRVISRLKHAGESGPVALRG